MEEVDTIERADALAHIPDPVLVILPDPDARVDRSRPILGVSIVARMARTVMRAGFAGVLVAPGVVEHPPVSEAIASGDPVDRPALVIYDSVFVHPDLLELMVAHPLDPDESYGLFDAVGRSVGWFTGRLEAIPSAMPTSEELPWPEELGPWSVARMVYPQDRERFERLILSAHDVLPQQNALWRQSVELQVLRLLLRGRLRVAQVESFAFLSVGAALPFVLTGTHLGMLVGALLLALGVQLSWLIGPLRTVRDHEGELPPLDSRPHRAALGPAIRPLGHAVFMATLTFAIVGGKTVDSSVAEPGLPAAWQAPASAPPHDGAKGSPLSTSDEEEREPENPADDSGEQSGDDRERDDPANASTDGDPSASADDRAGDDDRRRRANADDQARRALDAQERVQDARERADAWLYDEHRQRSSEPQIETPYLIASLVFISIGGFGAALLCLFQARRLLRGQNAEAFALPNGPTVVAQFGVKWPAALDGAPILELAVLAAALLGAPLWAWSLLAAAATARLWRWFVGGGDRTAARADNDARS